MHAPSVYAFLAEDFIDIEDAQTFEDLFAIAVRIIGRLPKPVGICSGPITSGGEGSIEKNIAKLQTEIRRLQMGGHCVFNQMPFEDSMQRIKNSPYYKAGNHLLETFYLPLFRDGHIQIVYFLPDWQSSYGATWEHDRAKECGLEFVYL